MKLSAPLFILKQQAKVLARRDRIPLHSALDRIAIREGFGAWSLLASAAAASQRPTAALFSKLRAGDLVLIGARPQQGKTLLSLDLAIESLRRGASAAFFTLELTRAQVAQCVAALEDASASIAGRLLVDDSDAICADYVAERMSSVPSGTVVVIDYLQLLDQRRGNPELIAQVRRLKSFARDRQLIVVCLAQIDRSYDSARRPVPELRDVRLPNPVDLALFDKTCFMHGGRMSAMT